MTVSGTRSRTNSYASGTETVDYQSIPEVFENLKEPFFGIENKVKELLERLSALPGLPHELLETLESWKMALLGNFTFHKLKDDPEAQALAAKSLFFLYFDVFVPIIKAEAETVVMAELQDEWLPPLKERLLAILKTVIPPEQDENIFLEQRLKAEIQTAYFLGKMEAISDEYSKLKNTADQGIQNILNKLQEISVEVKTDYVSHLTGWQETLEKTDEKIREGLMDVAALSGTALKLIDETNEIKDELHKQYETEKVISEKATRLIERNYLK